MTQDPETSYSTRMQPAESVAPRRRKVLHVYPDFGAFGGIERFILTVSRGLQQGGHIEPVVACTAGGHLFQRLQEAAIPVYGLSTCAFFAKPAWRMLDVATLGQLYWILQREKPDWVHVHIGHVENLLFSALGYPVVYSFHGYSSLYSLESTQNPLKRFLKKLAQPLFHLTVSRMAAMLFVSHAEQQRMIREAYLPSGIEGAVLQNGMDVLAFRQRAQAIDKAVYRETLGLPKDACCIGFINRLDANKNPALFIQLVERALQEPDMNDLHVLIVGDGPLAETIQARVTQSPFQAQIHVLGHRQDVPELLACCDLIIHPPGMEGFGFGVLEAMAVGVPCVAFAVGGIPEVLPEALADTLLVPSGDSKALYRKAMALLRRPESERKALSQQLQTHAEQWDLPVFLERLEAVYRRVLTE